MHRADRGKRLPDRPPCRGRGPAAGSRASPDRACMAAGTSGHRSFGSGTPSLSLSPAGQPRRLGSGVSPLGTSGHRSCGSSTPSLSRSPAGQPKRFGSGVAPFGSSGQMSSLSSTPSLSRSPTGQPSRFGSGVLPCEHRGRYRSCRPPSRGRGRDSHASTDHRCECQRCPGKRLPCRKCRPCPRIVVAVFPRCIRQAQQHATVRRSRFTQRPRPPPTPSCRILAML